MRKRKPIKKKTFFYLLTLLTYSAMTRSANCKTPFHLLEENFPIFTRFVGQRHHYFASKNLKNPTQKTTNKGQNLIVQ